MRYTIILLLLLCSALVKAKSTKIPTMDRIERGDLIFLDTKCGTLCDAITAVTKSKHNLPLSHVGIVQIIDLDTTIIEAVSKGVVATPWTDYKQKFAQHMYIGRWKNKLLSANFINDLLDFCTLQLGKAYDDYFKMDNNMYYCSELIYDAAKYANDNEPVFDLHPMTFKNPKTNTFDKGWIDFFKQINCPIPEGELGTNPGGLSLSSSIKFFKFISNK